MFKVRLLLLFFIGMVAIAVAGCGNKNATLKGKVTFADDGSPVPAGVVIFDNGAISASGAIQADGTYVAGFEKVKNGIPPGTYRVSISGAVRKLDNPTNFFPPPTEMLIHRKYVSQEDSGLSVVVDHNTKEYNIEVDRPEKKGR